MLPYKGGSSLIFTGQPNLKLPQEYNIDLESLFQGKGARMKNNIALL